ncbi:phage baseplate assembly protein V [Aneurinibacillus aneurinilyticus]|uniref:phage baseplate assembly protein V n=1 Tax=Aneurinibacillus aneurinilyticus TaxID=1391 RepID=UPI0023F16D2F|nr:phage baseplate assembly protein V [Aneurinibacillus aneurinilyticus]
MGTSDHLIGYGNIQFLSPYEVKSLSEMTIVKTVQDHARLYITGIIPEEQQDVYIEKASSTDTVKVNEVENGSVVRTLFSGLVSRIGIKVVRGIYYIELEAMSHTCKLDNKRKRKSFQNKEMRYTEMIESILKDYPGCDYIDMAARTSKLEKCIIQYDETDWAFLKRMASRFGAVLIPEATTDTPKFWFGLGDGKSGELLEHQYSVKKAFPLYMETTENGYATGLAVNDFLCYEVETGAYFNLGDRVAYKGKEWVIARSTSIMKQGHLTHEYTLSPEKGIRQNQQGNQRIVGASLTGKVIDRTKDTVRVHLDIDEAQQKEEAFWFPYATGYTAEGHSGWYCMPELGDRVELYVPGSREEEAVVLTSVRAREASSPKIENPAIKYWGTPHQKELMMEENELTLTAREGLFLKLHEADGVEIRSPHPIVFTSAKDIEMKAGSRLNMQAKEALYVLCSSSSLMMDGITDIQGQLVEMEGTVKGPPVGSAAEAAEEQEDEAAEKAELAQQVAGLLPGGAGAKGPSEGEAPAVPPGQAAAAAALAASVPLAGAAAKAKAAIKAIRAQKAGKQP